MQAVDIVRNVPAYYPVDYTLEVGNNNIQSGFG